jgi:hypothetical protein
VEGRLHFWPVPAEAGADDVCLALGRRPELSSDIHASNSQESMPSFGRAAHRYYVHGKFNLTHNRNMLLFDY